MTCPYCQAMIKPGQLVKLGYHLNCFYKDKENDLLRTMPRHPNGQANNPSRR